MLWLGIFEDCWSKKDLVGRTLLVASLNKPVIEGVATSFLFLFFFLSNSKTIVSALWRLNTGSKHEDIWIKHVFLCTVIQSSSSDVWIKKFLFFFLKQKFYIRNSLEVSKACFTWAVNIHFWSLCCDIMFMLWQND